MLNHIINILTENIGCLLKIPICIFKKGMKNQIALLQAKELHILLTSGM